MSYHDDNPSQMPDAHHAMVGGQQPAGTALVAPSANGAPSPMIVSQGPNFAAHQVLRGGMDANTFLHALRRRWLLALCMGVVAGSAAAIALWFLFPETSSATALFRVDAEPKSLVFDVNRGTERFEILQKTQLALLKSYFVMQAAVRDPAIASLSLFAGQGDPAQWLVDNLTVVFPEQSEILSITLSGDDPSEEQRMVVDAVAKAYREEVVYAERQRKLVTRDALARGLEKLNDEINRKLSDFYSMAKEMGVSQSQGGSGRDVETDLLLAELSTAQKKKTELEAKIMDMRTNFAVLKQQLEDPGLIDAQVDALMAQDPMMAMMQQQSMETQYRLQQATKGQRFSRTRSSAAIERELANIQNQIAQYRAETRAQLAAQAASAPNSDLQRLTKEFQIHYASMQQQWAGLNSVIETKMQELKTRVEKSVDLETDAAELEQLQEIAKDMSIKLESVDVETSASDVTEQITQIQPAIVTPDLNSLQHYAISILGGVGTFALTCFGIAYAEFIKRRLNDPEQVDEGLGIRVVGTLPSVMGRRMNPDMLVAHVSASIDSVRTLLMHDSTSKRRQVVLVTSAEASEGRTTVASQLAASLARAGRRTLLMDGDMRRPKLHELFDVPLEDGLCEVLRAEVDVADVIRPTHSEGLWLLTAGYCDRDSIQALATEQMQPIFDKLRGEYDFVIIDGAPALGISDALIFGQYSDGAILSVRRDVSQMPKIHQTAELLRGVGIRVLGAVVNGVPAKADDRIVQLQLITSKAERQAEPVA